MGHLSAVAVVISIVLTSTVLLSSPSAEASMPVGRMGRMETEPFNDSRLQPPYESFEWYEFFGALQMTGYDVIVDVAIVPFPSTTTILALDGQDGATFAGVAFQDGWVNAELPYRPGSWNDVRLTANFPDAHYSIRVNGREAGPFPFNPPSDSLQAFRVNGGGYGGREEGWIDSVSVTRTSQYLRTYETLLEVTFDDGRTFDLRQGSLTTVSGADWDPGGIAQVGLVAIVILPIALLVVCGYVVLRRRR